MLAVFGFHHHIIDVTFHRVADQVAKNTRHGTLVSGAGVLQSERHDGVVEVALWGPKCSVNGVVWVHLDLVVARRAVHEGQCTMPRSGVDDDFRDRYGEIVFGACTV